MSENRIECPLCRTGTYPHFGYTGSGVCDHCGAEWTYDETDTLTDNAMRALWEKIPRWIPVTERLPDEYEVVMVGWAGRRDIGKGYLFNGKWHDPLACMPDVNQPTHWMPLPAPPETSK